MKNIHNKNIVVGITGSIAAYKAADLVSKLKKAGANIKVVMTKSSTSFITERTLESISNNKVLVDENENDESFLHLDIAKWADIFLIAPCTANSFNKITSEGITYWNYKKNGIWGNRKTGLTCKFTEQTLNLPAHAN